MITHNWADVVRRFIVLGETPDLQHPMEGETPETYVERLYSESDKPEALRKELIRVLKDALRDGDRFALARALRLTTLIPHFDFAPVLQDIFSEVRLRGFKTPRYGDAVLQVIRAMHALQSHLPDSSEVRTTWKSMWLLYLDEDAKYGIAAYQGLRDLDPLLALSRLHLLLRREDLPEKGLEVLLGGLREGALDVKAKKPGARPGLVDELADAIAQLTGEKFLRYQSALREAFGVELDQAIEEARKKVAAQIGQTAVLLNPKDETSLRSLREQLFPSLAAWLKEQTPVAGVSIWLSDKAKREAHFVGQAGCCPGEEPTPPRILKFGEGASGKVAEEEQSRSFPLDDPESPVYLREEFLKLNIHGLFSVYVPPGAGVEPQLELIVNFFETSLDRLEALKEACIQSARTAAFVCQHLFDIYTKRWVAHLTAGLFKNSTLPGVTGTLVQAIKGALPLTDDDRVALYLFHSDVRRLFLYDVYPSSNGFGGLNDKRDSINYSLREALGGDTALRTPPQPLRLTNALDPKELDAIDPNKFAEFDPSLKPKLQYLGLDDLSNHVHLNYLGVSLRPATTDFTDTELSGTDLTGILLGVVEVYRRVESQSARVFTPLGEYIFTKLAETATNSLEKNFSMKQSPVVFTAEEMFGKLNDAGDINKLQENAEKTFKDEVEDFLSGWGIIKRARQHFYAFRCDPLPYDPRRAECKAFWPGDTPPRFDPVEFLARKALREAILANIGSQLWNTPALTINEEVLSNLKVKPDYWKDILKLCLTIVPLVEDKLLTGIIALKFDPAEQAVWAEKIKQEKNTRQFVSDSLLRIWSNRMGYFQTMVGTLNAHIWRRAESEQKVDSWKDVADYIRSSPAVASSGANTPDMPGSEELFNDLAKGTLQRTEPVGAECSLREACEEWRGFVSSKGQGRLTNKIDQSAKLMAMKPAVRMMLATATAVVLWGGAATFSLLEDSAESGWRKLQIEVSSNGNGNEVIRRQGLDLAKGITELKGWDYKEDKNGIVTVTLPRL